MDNGGGHFQNRHVQGLFPASTPKSSSQVTPVMFPWRCAPGYGRHLPMHGGPRQQACPREMKMEAYPKGAPILPKTFSTKAPVWLQEDPVALTRLLWHQSSAICILRRPSRSEWSHRMLFRPQIPDVSIRSLRSSLILGKSLSHTVRA